jgi:hypothetical protein
MAILNYADLARYMNKTFSAGEQSAAATILTALEAELSYILNRPLAPVRITDEKHLLEPGQRQLFLRKAPVRSVVSFYIGLIDSASATYTEQNIYDFDVYPWGIDNILIGGTGYEAKVTYNAGITDIDSAALERVILSAATREMSKVLVDAQGLERLKVEGSEYFFEPGIGGGFSEAELKSISRFKRRVIR